MECNFEHILVFGKCDLLKLIHGRVADAALGNVDDALQAQMVAGIGKHA